MSTAGIYALISFTLARRTREIGIRTALGAAPFRVITDILSRAFVQVGIGILLGSIPGTVFILQALDTEVSGRARGIIVAANAGVALFIIVVATIACIAPVRRSLRIQPTDALRTT